MLSFNLSSWALALLTATIGQAVSIQSRAPTPWTNYNDNGVFYPAQNYTSWRTLYARTVQLSDDSILLSWEDYDPSVALAYWPIYKSTDGGVSFSALSRVQDQVNGWGAWYQPNLYILPQALGGYPAGTILLAGTSTPRNLSHAYIDLYASTNGGVDWKFLNHIVYGPGPETTTNGNKAVWEPFLTVYNGELVCYYSSQVDPQHAQKLAHKTTKDLKTWSTEVNDVAQPTYGDRPGMATVAYSPTSKKYVMTFEYCGGPIASGCPVYHKVSDSPLTFVNKSLAPIYPSDGNINPNGSPYVIWTEDVGSTTGDGVFLMNGASREEIFVNTDAVDPNGWKPVSVGQWSAYSRSLRIVNTPQDSAAGGKKKLLIANGGNIGCSGSCYNFVATGLVDIPTYPS